MEAITSSDYSLVLIPIDPFHERRCRRIHLIEQALSEEMNIALENLQFPGQLERYASARDTPGR